MSTVGEHLPQGGGEAVGGEGSQGPVSDFTVSLLTHTVYHAVCDLIGAQTTLGRKVIASMKACLICSIINDFKYHDT